MAEANVHANLDTENNYEIDGKGIVYAAKPGFVFSAPKAKGLLRIYRSRQTNDIGTVSIRNIENLIGGDTERDMLIGNDGPNRLDTGDSVISVRQHIRGNGGADTFVLSRSTGSGSTVIISDFIIGDGDMLDLSAFPEITSADDLTIRVSASFLSVSFDLDTDNIHSGHHGVSFANLETTFFNRNATFDTIKDNIIYASE